MWKKHQSEIKSRRKIGSAVIALIILIIFLVFGRSLGFISSLLRPSDQTLSLNNKFVWDKKTSINLVLTSLDLNSSTAFSVLNYNPKDQKITILHMSDDIYIDVPKDYGSWRLGSIYKLGQEEKPPIGAKLLQLSIAKMLGLQIDGMIIIKDKKNSAEELLSNWHKNPLSILTFAPQTQTNLTPLDLLNLLKSLSEVRPDKISSLDLVKSTITESKLLPDNSRVLGIDTVKLDYFIRENMADGNIVDEGVTVAIFNATTHQGLAQEAARIVTNMGGTVTSLSNLEPIEKSQLILKSEDSQVNQSLTANRLTQIFAPVCQTKKCLSKDDRVISSRAQINIVLGEDFYNFWHKR